MSEIKVDTLSTVSGSGNLTVSNNIAGAGTISGTNITASGTLGVTGLITASAGVVIPNGQGIDFSATSDTGGMASELLDDYEEGTWTPAVSTASTHHSRVGQYTKIGNMVHIQCVIHFTQSGTTFGEISGLPFTVAGVNYSPLTFREWYSTGITLSGNLVIGGQSTSGFWNYANSSTAVNGQQYGYALSTTYRT